MKRLLCLFLMALALFAQSSGGSVPPMAAVLISPNLPVFAAMPTRPSFTPFLLVFAQRVSYDYAFELTVSYADGTQQASLSRIPCCVNSTTTSEWKQILTMGLQAKPVTAVVVAPITAGVMVPVPLSQ